MVRTHERRKKVSSKPCVSKIHTYSRKLAANMANMWMAHILLINTKFTVLFAVDEKIRRNYQTCHAWHAMHERV